MTASLKTKVEAVQKPSPAKEGNKDLLACAALLVLCVLLYFVGLDNFPFIDPSEAYYVEAAREMIQSGNYITPHLNYQIYFSKPIINFWMIIASYKLFGLSELSARLPFALLSSLLVGATFWFTRKIFSLRAGFIAAFCLATTPLLLLVSRKSSIDIGFTFFLDLAVFATALVLSKRAPWAWIPLYASLALGLLTKGPATLILYCAGMVAFLVAARPSFSQLKDWIGSLKLLAGIPLFFAIVLPWHIAVSMDTGGLFLKVFFWYENLARFQGHTNFGSVRYWFYLGVLGYGFFPWVALLPPAIAYALLGEKRFSGNVLTRCFDAAHAVRQRVATDAKARTLILLLTWSATTFVFFSVSRTQLMTYILPIMAPVCVLIGVLADRWITTGYTKLAGIDRFWIQLFGWLFGIAGIAMLPGSFAFLMQYKKVSNVVRGFAIATGVILAIGSIMHLRFLLKKEFEKSCQVVAVTLATALAIAAPLAFYVTLNRWQANLKAIAIEAGKDNSKVAMYGNFMPSSMFYSRKAVDTFFHGYQLKPARIAPPGQECKYPYVDQTIIVRDSEFPSLQQGAPCKFDLIAKKGLWGLYKTPGYELESVETLEATFGDPAAFEIVVKGKSPTGPLTVPYATGKMYQQYAP